VAVVESPTDVVADYDDGEGTGLVPVVEIT